MTSILIPSEEIAKEIAKVDEDKAEKIAEMWIDESKGVIEYGKEEIIKGAKMYLGLEELKNKYKATSILTSTGSFLNSKLNIAACLASTEYAKQGIACNDQEDTGPLLARIFSHHYAGRPSFMGDLIIDRYNNTSILVHCGAPVNPHGDDRSPYYLRDYRMGSDVLVELPTGEPVTIWRINVIEKNIMVYTGMTIPLDSVYGQGINNLHTILCATKIVAKVDAEKVLKRFNPQRYGVHWAATYGDYRERIKDFGKLIGFEVIECDKD